MIRRFLEWLFPFLRVEKLLARASAHGRVTLQEVELPEGVGWMVNIRPPPPPEGVTRIATGRLGQHKPHAARYAWTGQDLSLRHALIAALEEADEHPVMMKLDGIPHAPKLGGKEYDD